MNKYFLLVSFIDIFLFASINSAMDINNAIKFLKNICWYIVRSVLSILTQIPNDPNINAVKVNDKKPIVLFDIFLSIVDYTSNTII